MHLNIYCSFLYLKDFGTIIFNSLNGKIVAIKDIYVNNKNLFSILNNQHHEKWVETLYAQLIDTNIICEDDLDTQITHLHNLINDSDNQKDFFQIHINPTLDCNFRCWYCYENHISGSVMSNETLSSVKSLIRNRLSHSKVKNFSLGFFGGEPLMKYDEVVVPLMQFCNQICIQNNTELLVSFTTNGALLSDKMLLFFEKFDVSLQITLDGDKDSHDKVRFFKGGVGSYELILSNVKKALNKNIKVNLRINYTSDNHEQVLKLAKMIESDFISFKNILTIDLQRVWQDRPSIAKADTIEEKIKLMREKLRDTGFNIPDNSIRHSVTEPCYGDLHNYVMINYDGGIYGCTARDFNKNNILGHLRKDGTIEYNEKYYLRQEAKFSKKICKRCRIAPLCGGGCKQRAIDFVGDGCIYGYTEEDKNEIILRIIKSRLQLS